MRYISIDIETTGLDPAKHDVVEVAAVIDDLNVQAPLDELPTFHCYVLSHSGVYQTDPYCAFLHQAIFNKIAKNGRYPDKEGKFVFRDSVADKFETWLLANGFGKAGDTNIAGVRNGVIIKELPKFTPAGKNFGSFDLQFLKRMGFTHDRFRIHHRAIDPAMLYFDPRRDTELPNLQACMDRAGILDTVDHTGLGDALQVVKLIRHKFPLEAA